MTKLNNIMNIHGQCLLDYLNGDLTSFYLLERDDGYVHPRYYAKDFFHEKDSFEETDKIALEMCSGKILDLGAGAGSHSLYLLNRGFFVKSIDISRQVVKVMRLRGIKKAKEGDWNSNFSKKYNTILVLFGIGIAGNIQTLPIFLRKMKDLLEPGGVLLTDSIDFLNSKDIELINYTKYNLEKGRFPGTRKLRFNYKGIRSDWFEWMYIDPKTLNDFCIAEDMKMELLNYNNITNRYLVKIYSK